MARILIKSPITLYFSPSGSSSGDGSFGNPFDCPVTGWRYAQQNFDLGGLAGLVITFQMIAGTLVLPGVGNLVGPLVGQVDATSVKFLGNATTPSSCIIDGRTASTVALGGTEGAKFSFGGFKFYSGQANTAFDGAGTHAILTDPCISSICQDYQYSATNNAKLSISTKRYIETGGASHLNIFGGTITCEASGLEVNVMGNSCAYSQGFVSATGPGMVVDSNALYTGYNTTGYRVIISGGALVATGSSTPTTHFPGTLGVVNNGGYLT